jgi:hypothetical protein
LYFLLIEFSKSDKKDDVTGYFWQPVCPTSYYPLGHVSVDSSDEPTPYNLVTCVHERCVVQCTYGDPIWVGAEIYLFPVYENAAGINVGTYISVKPGEQDEHADWFLCLAR